MLTWKVGMEGGGGGGWCTGCYANPQTNNNQVSFGI